MRFILGTCIVLLMYLPLYGHAEDVSVLHPNTPNKSRIQAHADVVNPSPQSNPAGAKHPGYRATGQLIVYTPQYGARTGTNTYGAEAVVINNVVERVETNNTAIPTNGFVLSGQGQVGQWIQRVIKPGALVEFDPDSGSIVIITTPQVYTCSIQQIVDKIAPTAGDANPLLAQAQDCLARLNQLTNTEINGLDEQTATACLQTAYEAYYHSIPAQPDTYRGVWVRPTEQSEGAIREAITRLKAANIQHIFIETYYEGRTLYPSQVMARYGLPTQHIRFEGLDPLKTWITLAHDAGMTVHAWMQLFYAGNHKSTLEPLGPILQKYPEWANVQRLHLDAKQPQASYIEDGHYFLDPAHPNVRTFLKQLVSEVAENYAVDGINLDYIRYPSSQPAKHPSYYPSTWGYTAKARQAFKAMLMEEARSAHQNAIDALKKAKKPLPSTAAFEAKLSQQSVAWDPIKLTPSNPLWQRWVMWRVQQINATVAQMSQTIHAIKPQALVSAVVFPHPDLQNPIKLQDWPTWVQQGWVQALTPIGLQPTAQGMYADSVNIKNLSQSKVPVYIGIFGMYNRQTPIEVVDQVQAVFKAGLPGVVLFERSRLTPDYQQALLKSAFRPSP